MPTIETFQPSLTLLIYNLPGTIWQMHVLQQWHNTPLNICIWFCIFFFIQCSFLHRHVQMRSIVIDQNQMGRKFSFYPFWVNTKKIVLVSTCECLILYLNDRPVVDECGTLRFECIFTAFLVQKEEEGSVNVIVVNSTPCTQ